MFIFHLSLCCPRSKGSATSFSWSDALTRFVNNNPVTLCHNFYFICLWLSENEITRNSLGPKSNFHFPSSSLCPGLAGASRRLSPVLPVSPPPPPLQQPLVTVKVVMRCCQPWSRTLDNKAKVINWWWLDSNSAGPPWHVTCDAWYHKYLLIFWHHVTWSNFHLTPSPATHALHEPEPTYWANSQISIPGAVSDILQPSSCVLWKPTQQSLCFQEMRFEAGTLFQNLVAEGHSQLLSKAETKILWNDEITNIFVFYI